MDFRILETLFIYNFRNLEIILIYDFRIFRNLNFLEISDHVVYIVELIIHTKILKYSTF